MPTWPVAIGAAGMVGLTGLYIAVVSLAQGLDHALQLMVGDWYFVIPIVLVCMRLSCWLRHTVDAFG